MRMITSGCSWGAAAEVDTIEEEQLKQTQSGAVAGADTIEEQQLKRTHLWS